VVAGLLCLPVSACSEDEDRPSGVANSSRTANGSASPSPGSKGPEWSGVEGALSWEQVATVDLPYDKVNHPQVDGDHVVFAYADDRRDSNNSVGVWNWRTGRLSTLYETKFADGAIDWAEIAGGQVVFADQELTPTVGVPQQMQWRLLAVPAGGGKPQELSGSGKVGTPWEALAVPTGGPYGFVWTEWEDLDAPFAGRRVRQWRPGWAAPRDYARRILAGGLPKLSDKGLVFLQADLDRDIGGTPAQDLYYLEPGTTRPQRITASGLVADFEVHDDQVAWTERPHPKRDKTNRADPNAVYVAEVAEGADARPLKRGFTNGNPRLGDGFAVWLPAVGGVAIASTATGETVELLGFSQSIAARPDVNGSLLVFGERLGGAKPRIRLHLLEVTTSD
jgi:hypothetical protein